MTLEDKVNTLKTTVQEVAERAKSDNGLVEQLLSDPAKTIAGVAGQPIPEGLLVTAVRNGDGDVEISASVDPNYAGELEDASLEAVTGGTTAIEYGVITSLISVATIAAITALGTNLSSKLQGVTNKLG